MSNRPDCYIFKNLFDAISDPILLIDEKGSIQYVNSSFEKYFGYEQNELTYLSIEQLIPDFFTDISIEADILPDVLQATQKNGTSINIKINIFSVKNLENKPFIAIVIQNQINHREMEKKLYYLATHDHLTGLINGTTLRRRLKKLIFESKNNNTLLAICMMDMDNFKEINDSFNHETGDLLLKAFAKRLKQNTRKFDLSSRLGGDEFMCVISGLKEESEINLIITKLQKILTQPFKIKNKFLEVSTSIGVSVFPQDARTINTLITKSDEAMYHAKKIGKNTVFFYSKLKNIFGFDKEKKTFSETVISSNSIWNQEKGLDLMTTPINIHKQIQEIIQLHTKTNLFMLLINIDNFRTINNLLPYEISNNFLYKISGRLNEYFKKNEGVCAHNSADEFIILIHNRTVSGAKKTADNVLKMLSKSFEIKQHEINITASIGVSHYPASAKNAEELFLQANMALYRAKELGKNNYQFYNLRIKGKIHYAQQLQKDVFHVLDRNELFPVYQPQYDLTNQKVLGVESLLRWQHPVLGCINPDEFIPIMERTRQIIPVGEWVLLQSCQQAKVWQKIYPSLQIAVNVSSEQLRASIGRKNHIIQSVKNALEYSGLTPDLLELEITESIIMKDDSTTKNNLKKLKDLGVRIACDDFGVGYASFGRLKQLPLNTIKIDKSLIKGIGNRPIDFSIIRSIVNIAQQLNIKVIAEGVETLEQVNLLLDLGCTTIQGYIYCKPIKPTKMDLFLRSKRQFF